MADQLQLPEPPEPTEQDEAAESAESAESGEPGERPEPVDRGDEAKLAAAARHALHDEELVAAYAAGALETDEPDEVSRARALVERCSVCRDLHADLVTIEAAHRTTAGLVVAAARDFRLTEEDAERLRPGVAVVRRAAAAAAPAEPVPAPRQAPPAQPVPTTQPVPTQAAPPMSFLERIRAAFGSVARPLGGALVAAGLVGILVGSASFAAMPGGAPLPLGYDRQEASAPGATAAPAAQGGENGSNDGNDFRAGSMTVDLRFVVLGVSVGVALIGLVLLARSRRRARESD